MVIRWLVILLAASCLRCRNKVEHVVVVVGFFGWSGFDRHLDDDVFVAVVVCVVVVFGMADWCNW